MINYFKAKKQAEKAIKGDSLKAIKQADLELEKAKKALFDFIAYILFFSVCLTLFLLGLYYIANN
jgi:hypothetical protein